MAYAYEHARALPRSGSCVAVDDATVFAWTMRYFTEASIPADPDKLMVTRSNTETGIKEPPAAKSRKVSVEKKRGDDKQMELFGGDAA